MASPSMFQPGLLPAQTQAGNVFIGSTTNAGIAIPAYNATAQTFGLWNPAGSGVDAVLLDLNLGVATLGTPAVAAIGLSYLGNTGATIATGAPVSAFTDTTPLNGRISRQANNRCRFTLSATITAPSFFFSLGLSQETTAAQNGIQWMEYEFGGFLIVPPGTYIGLGGSAAPGQTFQSSLVWLEIPIVAQ
jgi:hypothetical protein